ncbi:MAG TPA: D-glycerate dehydrogenase [Alphaproteobacteria bacterium]|nr:D-glycerate dehydrogenase [Alphaproteobacteria bacterium]
MSASNPTVLVTRRLPERVEERLARDFDARLNADDKLLSPDELIAAADGAAAILPCPTELFPAEIIARLPEPVKIVACYSVGVDHVDLPAAAARGLAITNTPGVLSDATAEIAMLVMLGAARRAAEGETHVRSGAWDAFSPTFMLGTQLNGKRLGILGMGSIGRGVARRARGFGMEIHYHNRARLDPALEAGASYHATLGDLLAVSDVLSINCPATPETIHLIDAAAIERLPQGAILVNTARGNVVETGALISALRSGRLRAAGLDVFENEPAIDPAFRELKNTFLLPHMGSATLETREAMGFKACDNLDAFFAGRDCPDRVV